MDWSHYSIPAMRLEARFGDRVVPAFCERPKSLWAMICGGGGTKSGRRGAGLRRAPHELARGRASIGADRRGLAQAGRATRRPGRAPARQPHRVRAGAVRRGASRRGDGAARHPPAKAGDRLCADRLRREAADPRGGAGRSRARRARRSRPDASRRRRRRKRLAIFRRCWQTSLRRRPPRSARKTPR